MIVLLTGGSGYIGSHTCVQLLSNGHQVVILDNLSNSKASVLPVIERLTGKKPVFIQGDVRDAELLDAIFATYTFDNVIHFAGLKAVGESAEQPLKYYDNNVSGTLCLLQAMYKAGSGNLIFSSSATVYGEQSSVPYLETMPVGSPLNPYGRSKLMIEQILTDAYHAYLQLNSVVLLRYFNPVGAHPCGDMGEDPQGTPNNLMPYLAQVAVGRRDALAVFGNDYPTPDGTGIRDYIHVMDLADGHVAALNQLSRGRGLHIYNLGSGRGHSVLEVVSAFSQACGKPLNYYFAPRRDGDIAACWADASKAARDLHWRARRTLQDMVADTWRWQSRHPQGYQD